MSEMPDFDALDRSLEAADARAGAAEAHGILCGMLCAGQGVDRSAWFGEVFQQPVTPGDLLVREAEQQLDRLMETTLAQVDEGMLELRLELPDDEAPLGDRVHALGEWCEGFLLGFASAGGQNREPLPAEVKELLDDFVEITKVESRGLDEGAESDEQSYSEISEYVRMGVLMAFEQLRAEGARSEGERIH